MTCKDCIHYRMCITYQFAKSIDKEISECDEFQNNADFVEVVRCKDCEHYEADIICEGVGYCNEHQRGMRENNFCSYGEK